MFHIFDRFSSLVGLKDVLLFECSLDFINNCSHEKLKSDFAKLVLN